VVAGGYASDSLGAEDLAHDLNLSMDYLFKLKTFISEVELNL